MLVCQIPLSMGLFRRQFIGFDNKNFNVSRYSPFVQNNDAMMTSSNGSIFRFTGHLCGVASQITSLTIVYSTVYSGAVQRKYLSSPSLAFVRGIHRWPVNSPHKGQWRGALMFSLICARINGCVDNGEAGDFIRHRAHYPFPDLSIA